MSKAERELAKARQALAKIGGEQVERQIFLCAISEKQKCCSRKDGAAAWNYLKKRMKELKLVGRGRHRSTQQGRLPANLRNGPDCRRVARQCLVSFL